MKPHHKGEVAKEKAAGGLGYLIQKLKAALANVAFQNNSDNKRYKGTVTCVKNILSKNS